MREQERLARAQAGDQAAFAALLEAHAHDLYADLRARMPARWQSLLSVDDVLQETFTDAYLSIHAFSPRGDGIFAVWLKKLAQNNLLEAIRALEADKRGGGKRPLPLDQLQDAHTTLLGALVPQAVQSSPSRQMMRAEAQRALATALDQLPPRYRLAIERYDLEGRSIQETAAELRCSPGGAHLVRHRAMQRLRELLASQSVISRPPA